MELNATVKNCSRCKRYIDRIDPLQVWEVINFSGYVVGLNVCTVIKIVYTSKYHMTEFSLSM